MSQRTDPRAIVAPDEWRQVRSLSRFRRYEARGRPRFFMEKHYPANGGAPTLTFLAGRDRFDDIADAIDVYDRREGARRDALWDAQSRKGRRPGMRPLFPLEQRCLALAQTVPVTGSDAALRLKARPGAVRMAFNELKRRGLVAAKRSGAGIMIYSAPETTAEAA